MPTIILILARTRSRRQKGFNPRAGWLALARGNQRRERAALRLVGLGRAVGSRLGRRSRRRGVGHDAARLEHAVLVHPADRYRAVAPLDRREVGLLTGVPDHRPRQDVDADRLTAGRPDNDDVTTKADD